MKILPRLFTKQSDSITGAAIILSLAALISRLIGLLRARAFTYYFGDGAIMDAYYAAFKIPDLVYGLLVAGALSAAFIPIFTDLYEKNRDRAWELADNILNILAAVILFLAVTGVIFMPALMWLVAPGFDQQTFLLAVKFSRVMFISIFLLSISMIMGGILQSVRRFFVYSLAPIFYNLGIIAGVILLYPLMGEIGIAWGVVLGASLHLLLQAIGAFTAGFRWHPVFNLKNKETRLIAKLMIPRAAGLAITQLNTVILTAMASLLAVGNVAVYNYAFLLQGVPIGLIGIPFALAVFPTLSLSISQNNTEKFKNNFSYTIRQIMFLTAPMVVIFLLLRAQIVRVVLGAGKFDWDATIKTADTLGMFALGLFGQSLIPLLARSFYALSDTKTPFKAGVVSEIITVILAVILMRSLGVYGLALAGSIGVTINAVLLFFSLRKKMGGIDGKNILNSLLKISAAIIPAGLTIQLLKYPLAKVMNQDYFWGIFGQGLLAGIGGLIIYGLTAHLIKSPEFIVLKNSLRKKLLKIRRVQEDIIEMEN